MEEKEMEKGTATPEKQAPNPKAAKELREEQEKKERKKRAVALAKHIIIGAAFLMAVLVLRDPVTPRLYQWRPAFNWAIPFLLATRLAGLYLAGAVCGFLLNILSPRSGPSKTMVTLLSSTIRYVLALVGLFWGLATLGVDVTGLLAGAGVIALVIGFGAERLVADVITGIFMLFEHQYEVGDVVVVGNFRGTVDDIGIRTTRIIDAGGSILIINNADIRNLINRSTSGSVAVCDLGVPYDGKTVEKAKAVLEKAVQEIFDQNPEDKYGEPILRKVPEYLGVQELSLRENAAILRVTAEVDEDKIYVAQRLLNEKLMLALEAAGISNPRPQFPFPQNQ